MSKMDKEKLCIKFINQFSFEPLSVNGVYNLFEWLDEKNLLNKDGEEFIETFWEMFIEEEAEDD